MMYYSILSHRSINVKRKENYVTCIHSFHRALAVYNVAESELKRARLRSDIRSFFLAHVLAIFSENCAVSIYIGWVNNKKQAYRVCDMLVFCW